MIKNKLNFLPILHIQTQIQNKHTHSTEQICSKAPQVAVTLDGKPQRSLGQSMSVLLLLPRLSFASTDTASLRRKKEGIEKKLCENGRDNNRNVWNQHYSRNNINKSVLETISAGQCQEQYQQISAMNNISRSVLGTISASQCREHFKQVSARNSLNRSVLGTVQADQCQEQFQQVSTRKNFSRSVPGTIQAGPCREQFQQVSVRNNFERSVLGTISEDQCWQRFPKVNTGNDFDD